MQALQAAADQLDPEVIRQRLEYWILVLGPKFSKKDRATINLRRAEPTPHVLQSAEVCATCPHWEPRLITTKEVVWLDA